MSEWNPEAYLKFKQQRTQPALDLARRVQGDDPKTIADIGCGPGNSTATLRNVFPHAKIIGIDNSPSMIEKARASYPETEFLLCDAASLPGTYDLLFSNACLQWIPDHHTLIPHLMTKLNAGGALAVQVPMNGEEPLYRIIREVAAEKKWGFDKIKLETNETLQPNGYFDILGTASNRFDMWETVYTHAMPSHEHLLDWVRSTRLRPYLDALDEESGRAFEGEILRRVREVYPVMQSGEVLLRFRRFFFVAYR